MDTIRRHLTELSAMAAKTEAAERRILAQAQRHLSEVEARIKKLRSPAMVPGAAEAEEYQQAIMDRGRLNQVIAQAEKLLSEVSAES